MVWTLLLLLVSLCFAWAAAAALIFSLRRGTRPTRSRRVACRTDLIRRNDEHDDTCCRLDRFLRTEKHRWLGITSSISNTLIPLIINIDTQQRHELREKPLRRKPHAPTDNNHYKDVDYKRRGITMGTSPFPYGLRKYI